jgi:hypothetical protein
MTVNLMLIADESERERGRELCAGLVSEEHRINGLHSSSRGTNGLCLDGRTQTDILTDDGDDPSVERNVPRSGKIDGTIYSDQISMSEG